MAHRIDEEREIGCTWYVHKSTGKEERYDWRSKFITDLFVVEVVVADHEMHKL